MTSVPTIVFGPNGPVAPFESAILAGVQADINAAFSGRLNPALETPQGQWASSETAFIGDANDQQLLLFSGVDPAYASGRQQDGIARIYFLERNPALPTVVQCTCSGLVRASIPAGALAKDQAGNTYICLAGGTIGAGGTVSLPFQNTVAGPIPCPTGSLNIVYRTTPGWDSVTNPASGVVGSNVEGRAAFELRRQDTVEANSIGPIAAMLGAVLKVPAVLDAFVVDNPTSGSVTIDGVSVPAHGVFACVAGGNPLAVATALWSKKAPGAPWSGGTTETVTDPNPVFASPPSYSVSFQIATAQEFIFLITLKGTPAVPNNAEALIQATVLAAWAGTDGGPNGVPPPTQRARIGSLVLASRYAPGILALGSWPEIETIKLGSTAAPAATITASSSAGTLTVSAVSSAVLAVGDTIFGVGYPAGVQITAQLTGSPGDVGTYSLSIPTTVGGGSLLVLRATLDFVQVGSAHVPVLAGADISVVLV